MKRILIVDDEPQMTRVLKLYLERAGYLVESAPNGLEALTRIKAAAPDVLVTDIQMPIMTGKELCQALSEQFPQRTFPIFVMTSMTDSDHREWTRKIDNLELLEKPVSMRALIARLDKHFSAAQPSTGAHHA